METKNTEKLKLQYNITENEITEKMKKINKKSELITKEGAIIIITHNRKNKMKYNEKTN